MGDEDEKSYEASDDTRGVLVLSGTGEQRFMRVSLDVINKCTKVSKLYIKNPEGQNYQYGGANRVVSPGQTLQIRAWVMGGADSVYFHCNGNPDDEGCAISGIKIEYTESSDNAYD